MMFPKGSQPYSVEVERKKGENIMYVNYLSAPYVPDLARDADVMDRTVTGLLENPNISKLVFVQQRNYYYGFEKVKMLLQMAEIYNYLTKHEGILSPERLSIFGTVSDVQGDLVYLLNLLKRDPLACYYELRNKINSLKRESEQGIVRNRGAHSSYIRFLEKFKNMLEDSSLLQQVLSKFDDYTFGDRTLYEIIFRADILPNFTFTRLVAQLPRDAELIDQYEISDDYEEFNVTILKRKDETKYIYHVMPSEYSLNEEQYNLVNLARNVLSEHRPKEEDFNDPEKTREVFFNISKDLISELARSRNINLSHRNLIILSRVLIRHTIGFGLIEVLLMDSKLQDVSINAPIAQNPVFVRHEEYEECVTNIVPSYEDADSWAAKLRLQSGRPLDEANPILDTDLKFGDIRARVAAISEPLSPRGLAFSIRRQRDRPWTLPLFIDKGMLNSFSAGLLSFLIDGNRTLLVAGTRSAGKTSLLGSLMLEIMPKYRAIVVEDTLELPVDAMRFLGYDILRMKVRSALTSGSTEVGASEGIRTSLRLGDSALIVGEVRSEEALALYEAMRVGALANVVAGTIHGDSPYGVFDRVVNDLKVQPTSFKATDVIIVTNPIKSSDGLTSKKRVVRVTEVRKHWEKDPEQEGGFVDLLRYNVKTDQLEPTDALINGDSEIIKSIASNVVEWAGNWDAVYDNILLRGKMKQEIVDASKKYNDPEIMESKFCVVCNESFHRISNDLRKEGVHDSDSIFEEWKKWLYAKLDN